MPVPDLSNATFPEIREFIKHDLRHEIYTFPPTAYYTFPPTAYVEASVIWNGEHPEDGSELEVIQGAKKSLPYPVLEEEPQLNSPGEDNFDPTMFADVAKELGLDKDMKAYQGQGGFTRSKSPCPLARALFVAGCGP